MSADTPSTRCEYYRRICHLPARVEPTTGRISVRAGLVWAIQLPAGLAQVVKMDLDRRQHGGGPIITAPREARWTFLTRSDIPATIAARDMPLWRNQVTILRDGQDIVLPSPTDRGHLYRAWITPAHSTFRPSGLAVLDSIRVCLTAREHADTTTRLYA
ncbi:MULTISPECIES: DNA-directed RNA polymerase subunit beta [Nocardia]|uniref:DNA-directed RNA polymerase subunit beta n=1 Tax=Nocardia TaxID=1817 RepID=UPI000D690B0D|nr:MULTISPECIES: DNA-directed RNA polymerase subunit beta [Nocardia]